MCRHYYYFVFLRIYFTNYKIRTYRENQLEEKRNKSQTMSDDVTSSVTVKSDPIRFDGFRFRFLSTALRDNIIRSTARTSMQQ